jgi:integration host factor subunit beta
MIKSELAQRIARKNRHLYQADAEKIVDAVLDSIVSALARRERVELRGFGTFSAKVHPARSGRNPKTGAVVALPERALAAFRSAKEMRNRLNGSEGPIADQESGA